MAHDKYESMISEYIDGELNEADEKELSLHLENCRDCSEYLDFVKKLSQDLTPAGADPSPDFAEKLMDKFPFENLSDYKKESKLIRLFNNRKLALAACLALVIIAALFALPETEGDKSAALSEAAKAADVDAHSSEKEGNLFLGSPAASDTEISAEENELEQNLISVLGFISSENPALRLYDSSENMVYENPDGAKFIDALLADSRKCDKEDFVNPDFKIVLLSENKDLSLDIYLEGKSFYIHSENLGTAYCANKSFIELIKVLFDFSL